MLKVNTYSAKGTKLETFNLPKNFDEKVNLSLLAQAARVYESNAHFGMAKTQTRAEVNRTTKKIYKQKGTGGARHGSRRAPIYVGGGVAHGPQPLKRILELPQKMANKALKMAWTFKVDKKEVVVVDKMSSLTKTKDAESLFGKIKEADYKDQKSSRFTIILAKENLGIKRTLDNLSNVKILNFDAINAYDVTFGGILIVDKDVFGKAEKAVKEVKTEKKVKVRKVSKK